MSDDQLKQRLDNLEWMLEEKGLYVKSNTVFLVKKYIEELEKACKEWSEVSQSNYQRAKAAEAKLADAMEALQFYRSAVNLRIDCEITHAMQEAHIHTEAFIAKIKGEQL